MKKILRTISKYVTASVVLLLYLSLTEFYTEPWYLVFENPEFWIMGGSACLVTCLALAYFIDINPRKFYYCVQIVPASICTAISTLILIVLLVLIALMQNVLWKVVLLILAVAIHLLSIYLFIHRGICVYKNGKIRVFKGKVKTYIASEIDNVQFAYQNKKCTITVTINGNKEKFRLSNSSARLAEKRLKQFIKQPNQGSF